LQGVDCDAHLLQGLLHAPLDARAVRVSRLHVPQQADQAGAEPVMHVGENALALAHQRPFLLGLLDARVGALDLFRFFRDPALELGVEALQLAGRRDVVLDERRAGREYGEEDESRPDDARS